MTGRDGTKGWCPKCWVFFSRRGVEGKFGVFREQVPESFRGGRTFSIIGMSERMGVRKRSWNDGGGVAPNRRWARVGNESETAQQKTTTKIFISHLTEKKKEEDEGKV